MINQSIHKEDQDSLRHLIKHQESNHHPTLTKPSRSNEQKAFQNSIPGGGAVEVGRAGLAGHPLGGHGKSG